MTIKADVISGYPYFVAIRKTVAKIFVVPIDANEDARRRGKIKALICESTAVSKRCGITAERRNFRKISLLLKE